MRVRATGAGVLLAALIAALISAAAAAHESKVVGPYRFSVGMRVEPPYTEERNGLDLVVRKAADNSPIEGLEKSLEVELTAPDGQQRRYALQPKHGEPGRYVTDWVLTQPGVYRIRIFGYVGGRSVDETFESHEVRPISELRFPPEGHSQAAHGAPPVQVVQAWARPAAAMESDHGSPSHGGHPTTAATSAIYMTLVNGGDRPQKLVAVRTPVAKAVELHETRIEGQVARMRPVEGVEIPPHGRVQLAPGGLHVMLIGLTRDLKPGDHFPATLRFEDGSEVAVEVEVRQP